MNTDSELKAHVIAELAWDPAVGGPTQIGVSVRDGIVTLGGQVETYMQKFAAERAVRRVKGVRGIALDLEVRTDHSPHAPSDAEITHAALLALRWHTSVPQDGILVEVEDGRVTLTGEVDWTYQSASAEQCVRPLLGVKGVVNKITIRPRASATDIASGIVAAFSRHAQREARHISVDVDGGVVTLRGDVDSLRERDAAIGTAWCAKGVTRVVDQLKVIA